MKSTSTNIKRMYIRRINVLQHAKAIIRGLIPDAEIILYGSRARGNATPDSDWDLLVLTNQKITPELEEKLWDALYIITVERGEVISAVVKNRLEWSTPFVKASPYHQEIDQDGVWL